MSRITIITLMIVGLCTRPTSMQGTTCPTACQVGFTCYPVRHGNGPAVPSCISMQEALLVQQALNGGPSGPGSGINEQTGAMSGQGQFSSMGTLPGVPGMPMPGMPGGIMPGMAGQMPGMAGQMPGMTGQFPGMAGQMPGMAGQMPGMVGQMPGMPGVPPQGAPIPGSPIPGMDFLGGSQQPQMQNFEQRFNSGQSPGQQWQQPNSLAFGPPPTQFGGIANSQMQGPFGGPGFVDPTTGQQVFPAGENTNPSSSLLGGSSGSPSISSGQVPSLGAAPSSIAEVTSVQEDAFGYFYMFHADPNGFGIRVNITKGGYCDRPTMTSQPMCINMCFSDDQCPRHLKCCPSTCALECAEPLPDQSSVGVSAGGAAGGMVSAVNAVESQCVRCTSHVDCVGQAYCAMSSFCGNTLVCQQII